MHNDRIPFYFVPYRKVPNSIWGMGVAEMMFDSQDAINACERAKMDNMALCSKPLLVVHPELLHPAHRNVEITAGRIFVGQLPEVPTVNTKPVEDIRIDSRLNEIETVQRDHFQFIQEQTGIPNALMGMGGQGTHNRTAEGATLQFNAAATALKSVVYNFETYLVIPMTNAMARFYQLFSGDKKITGDYRIYARGLQGLMARENLVGDLLQLMQVVGTVPQWAERMSMDRVFDLFIRAKGMTSEQLTIPAEIVAEMKMLEQQAANEQQLAMDEAQAQVRQRAETSPRQALIEVLKEAEPGPFKTELMGKILTAYDLLDEQLEVALETQKTLEANKMLVESETMNAEAKRNRVEVNVNSSGKPKRLKLNRDETGQVTGFEPEYGEE